MYILDKIQINRNVKVKKFKIRRISTFAWFNLKKPIPINVCKETTPSPIEIINKLDNNNVLDNKFNIYFMKLAAIILAAGNSFRFKNNTPKQFHFYKNDIIINHSIKKLDQFKEIKEIYIAIHPKYQKKYISIIKKTKKIKFFKGGKYRSLSVKNGINKLIKKYTHVIIHDAARPDVSTILLTKIIKELRKNDCVVPAVSATDTIIFNNQYLDRDEIKIIQTPQAFNLKKLFNYHKLNKNKKITDDTVLFSQNNDFIKIIRGEDGNKKITFTNDIWENRIFYGIGYDIHKMSIGYDLFIGGIKIPSKYGSVGHSDGDSLIHALIDSFLGAAKLSDIGTLFPNNKKFKGIRSDKLLIAVIKKFTGRLIWFLLNLSLFQEIYL